MLKRSMAAIQQWLSSCQTVGDEDICNERRFFFKRAAAGTASITGTAVLAKVVVDAVPQPSQQELYRKDGLAGEQELMEREYVLMTDQEKSDMVQSFVDSYSDQS